MNKAEIIEKLQSMGTTTSNAYPKSTFVHNGDVMVGLYNREMLNDFYFFNKFDKKLYRWPFKTMANLAYTRDGVTDKYLVPLDECEVIWEDKPFVELPDKPYKEMTLREYACIHLRIADSGNEWLDTLIKTAPTP